MLRSKLRTLYRYAQFSIQHAMTVESISGRCVALSKTLLLFPKWYRYRGSDGTIRPIPRFVFESVAHIQTLIRPTFSIFEYGSGGSTLWYAQRVASVIAIEHHEYWWEKIRSEMLKYNILNCELKLVPPDPDESARMSASECDPNQYASHRTSYQDFHFRNYVNSIAERPDNSLDLVSVDGRARPACILHAIPKLRPGGYLVLDDAERASYQRAKALLAEWPRKEFSGLSPYTGFLIKTTSVYTKPDRLQTNEQEHRG